MCIFQPKQDRGRKVYGGRLDIDLTLEYIVNPHLPPSIGLFENSFTNVGWTLNLWWQYIQIYKEKDVQKRTNAVFTVT